jgi:hypothetical protein
VAYFKGLRNTTKYLSQDSQCPGRVSNRAPSEYESEASLPDRPCEVLYPLLGANIHISTSFSNAQSTHMFIPLGQRPIFTPKQNTSQNIVLLLGRIREDKLLSTECITHSQNLIYSSLHPTYIFFKLQNMKKYYILETS